MNNAEIQEESRDRIIKEIIFNTKRNLQKPSILIAPKIIEEKLLNSLEKRNYEELEFLLEVSRLGSE